MLIENNDSFLSELTRMFNLNREKNGASLYITMKKYRQKIGAEPKAKEKKGKTNKKLVIKDTKPQERKIVFSDDNKCIIRAKIGNKKISTIINAKDLDKFQAAYSSLLLGNLYGLKKKVVKKNEQQQQKKKETSK